MPLDLGLLAFVFPPPSSGVIFYHIFVRSTNWQSILVALISDCAALRYVEGVFFEITLPATSLLFFFRVKGVYNNSRPITIFFGFLWLAIAGLSILTMFGIRGSECLVFLMMTWVTTVPQNVYHIRCAVPRCSCMHTQRSRLFWPLWMIPSCSWLFRVVWSLGRWSKAPGAQESSRLLGATAYSICPSLCCKADKRIICQFRAIYVNNSLV